jgi:hypothetical protein
MACWAQVCQQVLGGGGTRTPSWVSGRSLASLGHHRRTDLGVWRATRGDEQQRKDSEVKVEHLTRLLQSDRHLPTLQARVESLHAAKLLSDEELYAIWDVIADSVDTMSDDTRVLQLVELSARMLSDTVFSRQLRRKML